MVKLCGVTSVRNLEIEPNVDFNLDLHAPQTFLHNSNEHVLEQVMSLLIAGEAVEQRLGSVDIFVCFRLYTMRVLRFGCGSWQIFGMYPPPHLRKSVRTEQFELSWMGVRVVVDQLRLTD